MKNLTGAAAESHVLRCVIMGSNLVSSESDRQTNTKVAFLAAAAAIGVTKVTGGFPHSDAHGSLCSEWGITPYPDWDTQHGPAGDHFFRAFDALSREMVVRAGILTPENMDAYIDGDFTADGVYGTVEADAVTGRVEVRWTRNADENWHHMIF